MKFRKEAQSSKAASERKRTAVIYGTLSETDSDVNPDAFHSDVEELSVLRRRFDFLVQDYTLEVFTRADFMLALSELIETDASGAQWTIGALTGQFYRRENEASPWVATSAAKFAS